MNSRIAAIVQAFKNKHRQDSKPCKRVQQRI